MKLETIKRVISQWNEMTRIVLELKEIPVATIEKLLKDTHIILTEYQNEPLVPKEIVKLFLEMDDFLYFASLMENKEVGVDFYHYQEIHEEIKALKYRFFVEN